MCGGFWPFKFSSSSLEWKHNFSSLYRAHKGTQWWKKILVGWKKKYLNLLHSPAFPDILAFPLKHIFFFFFFSGQMPSFSYITVLYKNVVLECFCIFRNLRGSMGNLINTYSTTVRKNEVLGLSCTREIFSVETQITTKNRDVVLLINTYVCKLWKIIYIMAFK